MPRVRAVKVGTRDYGRDRNRTSTTREPWERKTMCHLIIGRNFPALPSLVYVPAVYDPAVRYLVLVPTVSHPAVCPAVPIPSRRSHTAAVSPIPHLTAYWGSYLFPFHLQPVFSRFHNLTMDTSGFCATFWMQQRYYIPGIREESGDCLPTMCTGTYIRNECSNHTIHINKKGKSRIQRLQNPNTPDNEDTWYQT